MANQKKELSRREFLKSAGIVAGSAAIGATFIGCAAPAPAAAPAATAAPAPAAPAAPAAAPVPTPEPEKWDMEADVVIIGMGGAGASAAIEAHDAGAKVLVVEKQAADHHFSNSRMSGGVWHNPVATGDRAARVEYIKAMMSGENIPWKLEGEQEHVSGPMAEMFADGIMELESWLLKMDPDLDPAGMAAGGDASFPMFPKFAEAQYGATVSTRYKDYANADTKVPIYERPKEQKQSGEALMHCIIEEGIKKQRPDIEILYETPAQSLIQAEDGSIHGCTAIDKSGKELKIKAKKAVILSCGGFEYSVALRRAFQEGPGIKGWGFYGSPDNTGDGIKMAMLIGAGLAKVAKSASRIEAAFPGGIGWEKYGLKMGVNTSVTSSKNSCIVDNFGVRYADEHIITDSKRPYRYQFYKEAVKYDMIKMMYPRIPSWCIYDETRQQASSIISSGSSVGYGFVPWKGNEDAVEKGWVLKADTLEELAEKIMADPENRESISADTLKATIKEFNSYCAAGEDKKFGRTPATMAPVETPPFYAVKMYPGGPNTKGGVDADATRHVLTWEGEQIPRLYTAGEISSVFKFTYQAGGNITECMVCGRLAGKNAAAETAWA